MNLSALPRHTVKPLPTSHPVTIPDNLKTPKELVLGRQSIGPVANLGSVNPGPLNTSTAVQNTIKPTHPPISSMDKRCQGSDGTDIHQPPLSPRDESEPQEKRPLPHPPLLKKRPKEVSMFIPKKKPDLKVR